jgi:hypothetical protein
MVKARNMKVDIKNLTSKIKILQLFFFNSGQHKAYSAM